MEYKVTFEDGSEAYLAHYGVKGMKWKHRKNPEEGYEINAERLGYNNDAEGRKAAYDESGLNRHMSREQAARKIAKQNAKYEYDRRKSGVSLSTRAKQNVKQSRKLDRYLVNSLPTRKQKQKSDRKARMKAMLSRSQS